MDCKNSKDSKNRKNHTVRTTGVSKKNEPNKVCNLYRYCGRCNLTNFTKTELDCHLREVHGRESNDAICGVCQRYFLNPAGLSPHYKKVHDIEWMWKCSKCGFTAEWLGNSSNHVGTMSAHTYCDVSTKSPKKLVPKKSVVEIENIVETIIDVDKFVEEKIAAKKKWIDAAGRVEMCVVNTDLNVRIPDIDLTID